MKQGFAARFHGISAWVQGLRPVRVFRAYLTSGGNLLAAGMSFQAVFAVFAAVWVGFSFFSLYLSDHPAVEEAIIGFINIQIPGFIGKGGAIDPALLTGSPAITWSGAVAVLILLYTAIGWLNYTRTAIHRIFDLPPSTLNVVLLKIYDLLIALGYGLVIIVSATASVIATKLIGIIATWAGIAETSLVLRGSLQVGSVVLILLMDTFVLASMIRLLSGVPIPWKRLFVGSFLGGIVLGALKIGGTYLLAGTSQNPLLASFAVFIGLLVWFNIACRVYLLSATWIALGMSDLGLEAKDSGWIFASRAKRAARIES
jgi:membrane protein